MVRPCQSFEDLKVEQIKEHAVSGVRSALVDFVLCANFMGIPAGTAGDEEL